MPDPIPPDRMDPLSVDLQVAEHVGELLHLWTDEYLARIERQLGEPHRAIARPDRPIVRHAGVWRRGESTPVVIVWPEGLRDVEHDPGSGAMVATVEVAVRVIAGADDEDNTTRLVNLLLAATRAILLHHAIAHPLDAAVLLELALVDQDNTGVSADEHGGMLAGATLSYLVPHVYLGRRAGGPPRGSLPRDDSSPPWGHGPTVQLPPVLDIAPDPNL